VPQGQVVTKGFPVLNAGSIPIIRKEDWIFQVHGEVSNPLALNYSQLVELKHTIQKCDIHCVTSWSKLDTTWEGIKFKDLMDIAMPTPKAKFVVFECEQGFTTNVPFEVAIDDDVLVAFKFGGNDLPAEHGGPVRMLVPKRYFYKSAKWLTGIKISEFDEPGFWEIRGYSNSADPWKQERYAFLNYADIIKNRLKAYGRRKSNPS
jgi:DMSO/TMAO reductase YedYZ molybdopterin-dependent catalytic subunit